MSNEQQKSTMVELVEELEKLPQTPEIAEMIAEAKAGEYHDYKNQKYDCGKVAVVGKLEAAASLPRTPRAVKGALKALRQRVVDGEFDETADEEDKAMMRRETPREMWPALGL